MRTRSVVPGATVSVMLVSWAPPPATPTPPILSMSRASAETPLAAALAWTAAAATAAGTAGRLTPPTASTGGLSPIGAIGGPSDMAAGQQTKAAFAINMRRAVFMAFPLIIPLRIRTGHALFGVVHGRGHSRIRFETGDPR